MEPKLSVVKEYRTADGDVTQRLVLVGDGDRDYRMQVIGPGGWVQVRESLVRDYMKALGVSLEVAS